MRKLASIQTIETVEPIPGADAIEKAQIGGWWVVVKKGEHQPGDRVVYCEIDALLPERPEFEFLRKNCFKHAVVVNGETIMPAGFRIKTVKLRGQISQGIAFPLSILPDGTPIDDDMDVTEALDIVKYDTQVLLEATGNFNYRCRVNTWPSFLPKTDETRIQSCKKVLERHQGVAFEITEKLDGSSLTAFIRDGEFGLCSRNQRLDANDEHMMSVWARAHELEARMREAASVLGFDFAIQGEFIGPKVQGNKYQLAGHYVRPFNMFNIATGTYERGAGMRELAGMLGLVPVPHLMTVILDHTVDELVQVATGTSTINPAIQREGIVLRPVVEQQDSTLGRLSFKVINPAFLLKYDE